MNPENPLDNVRIVLSHPSHPGNIGASARAMKTMGLSSLVLVNPRFFPDREADVLASKAVDVLTKARVCTSLDEALSGTVLAAALSARRRELSHAVYSPSKAAGILLQQAQQKPVALVFGGETSGLSNEQIIKCQMLVRIPANPDYSALNLAAAVQVMCYELRLALENSVPRESEFEAASFEEIEMFYRHLENVLVGTGFLNPEQPKRLMERLRRLFSRTRLEKDEVDLLRGILNSIRQ
ncbi:MAG TPA: RNA methyltransferase [Burkholderiales bacterium]|nr:RNA methyltransferase [Burkholderiales bacterium]